MNYQLTIAEGKEAGREFVFDKETVSIGRSDECDVVLYDPGVSRRHARLTIEHDGIVVEDSGSANGTKVNGELLPREERRLLQDGDQITMGPVVFSFTTQIQDEEPSTVPPKPLDQSTRIVDISQIKRQKNRGVGLVPAGVEEQEALGQLARTNTASIPAVSPRARSKESRALAKPTERPASGASRALARVPEKGLERAGQASVARPVRDRQVTPARALSAVERSRLKREAREGLIGVFKLWWAEASNAARGAIYGAAGLAAFGVLALIWVVVLKPADKGPDIPEPDALTSTPIEHSFGLGPGVTFQRSDQKSFTFTYVAATRAVVILHYQSRDISEGEVRISVNGQDVGGPPADPINPTEVTHELIFPPDLLKKAETNVVAFDNVNNPPGNDPWSIWNVWIEVAPLPEQPPSELLRDARAEYSRGLKALESKDIGAGNRYDAWRSFRSAWLRLEAHPDPKPDLYELSKLKIREAQHELDAVCAKLLLEVERAYNQQDYGAAMSTLEHIREYFPSRDQACLSRADRKRMEMQL